ncbi:MAG: oxidoreductase, partial [Cytophagaceae bacterium]
MDFTGKNILLVGASSGIGLATAQLLHASGATLFTASRHLSPELAALGTTHLAYDATQPVGTAFDALPEVLHGLVYCPGSIKLRPF